MVRKSLQFILVFVGLVIPFTLVNRGESSVIKDGLEPQKSSLLQANPCEGFTPDDLRSGLLTPLPCKLKCIPSGVDPYSISDEQLWACINGTGGEEPEPPPVELPPEEPDDPQDLEPPVLYDSPCTGLDVSDLSWIGASGTNPIYDACVQKCSEGDPGLLGRSPDSWTEGEALNCICQFSEPAPSYCYTEYTPETDFDTIWASKLARLIRNPLIAAGGAAAGSIMIGLLTFFQSFLSSGTSAGTPGTPVIPTTNSGPPQIGDVNENGQIWFRPPWDQGGAHWVDQATYNDIQRNLRKGLIWSDRWGWVTPSEEMEREAMRQRALAADARDRAKFHESIRREQEELRAKQREEMERKRRIQGMQDRQDELEWQRLQDNRDAAWNSPAVLRETGRMTSREVFTGQTADGGTSFKAMTLRLLTGVLTGGESEYFFTSVDGAYRVKDKLDNGESLSSAILSTAGELAFEEAIGRGIAKGASKGLGLVKRGIKGAKGVLDEVPGIGKAGKADLPSGKGPDLGDAARAVDEPLPRNLQSKKDALDKALQITDPEERAEALSRLYRQGGMDELSELERLGHIKPDQARELNDVVSSRVNKAVDDGVKKTINEFQDKTGVKVKEVMVGDSGSSARPGRARSIKTDADRTSLVTFDENDLQRYADQYHGGDTSKAYDRLSKRFADAQDQFVDDSLRQNGLSAHDVDYKTYDRFGKPGPSDSYPDGYVRTTQATQGKTTVYKPQADGDIGSYQTSGQAMTDQDALIKQSLDGGNPPVEPAPRITPQDAQKLIDQQLKAVSNPNISPEKAAKALLRADKGVSLSSLERLDPKLVETAKMWREFPQMMSERMGVDGQRRFIEGVQEALRQAGK
jgi:hypothetical protein